MSLFASLALFTATLLAGLYLLCWAFALPFAAVMCARLFSDDRKVIISTGQ